MGRIKYFYTMKNREQLKKAIKDLKMTLDSYEMQIQSYRKHIELLIRSARKPDANAASQKLPTTEAEGKTAPDTLEVHETVASFIAKLTTETRLNKLAVKKVAKPYKGIKKEAMSSNQIVHRGTHGSVTVVKIE
jgi:hypothetical protein